jgi:TonB family protein
LAAPIIVGTPTSWARVGGGNLVPTAGVYNLEMSKVTSLAGCLLLTTLLRAQTPPMIVPPYIQQRRLIYRVSPVYPKLAKQAHIQGTVKLAALIDEDGVVDHLKLISGHPLLVKAAFDAAKQWRYLPSTRNGVPVAVTTIIEITFTMNDRPPPGDKQANGSIRA